MDNQNHPLKGSILTVDPLRSTKDIDTIKKLLWNNPRDYALFVVGINTNLRATDLLSIQVEQVKHAKAGDRLDLREKKTGKLRSITINWAGAEAINRLVEERGADTGPLFVSQRGGKAITKQRLNRLVHTWTDTIRLKGRYGCHSLRKTFGYIHRTKFGTDIPTLIKLYNHSSQRQTLDYLGIQEQDLFDAYLRDI